LGRGINQPYRAGDLDAEIVDEQQVNFGSGLRPDEAAEDLDERQPLRARTLQSNSFSKARPARSLGIG